MQARHYQTEAIEAAFREWENVRSTLVQIPTGGGKTFVAAQCAKRQTGRTLFIVHLREIVRQAKDELHKMTGLPVGMELSADKSSTVFPEPIICASVQTLNGRGRLQKFDPEEFSLIIGDEFHHGLAKSWRNVLDYFPNAKVLGLTATPERTDKKKLGEIIDSIAYQYSLKQACDDGYLVKPRQLTITIPGLDFTKIPRKKGDYSTEELGAIMIKYAKACAHRSIEAIFDLYPHELDSVPEDQWSDYVGDRPSKKTLIFCVTRLHAEKVMNALNSFREGLCGYVDGETPHIERRNTFRNFKHGDLTSLANCGVTVEGYDNAYIKIILDMAPTMSHPRALQKWGRGTRSTPGTLDGIESAEERLLAIANSDKPYCTVVDFTDNSRDHRLVTVFDILGGEQSPAVRREFEKRTKEKVADVEEEIKLILKERYELNKANFEESEIDGFTGKRKKKKLTKEEKEARRIVRDAKGLSDKQFELLKQQKLHPERRTLEENKALLKQITYRRLAGLCSFAQGFVLQKYGYSKGELQTMKRWEAKGAIDEIAANGWKPVPKISSLPKQELFFTDKLINETESEYGNYEPAF